MRHTCCYNGWNRVWKNKTCSIHVSASMSWCKKCTEHVCDEGILKHKKKNFCKNKFSTPLHACFIHIKYRLFYTVGPWRNYKERSYSKSRRSWTCSKKKFRKRRDKPCLYCTFFWWSKHNRSSRGYQGNHVW